MAHGTFLEESVYSKRKIGNTCFIACGLPRSNSKINVSESVDDFERGTNIYSIDIVV